MKKNICLTLKMVLRIKEVHLKVLFKLCSTMQMYLLLLLLILSGMKTKKYYFALTPIYT